MLLSTHSFIISDKVKGNFLETIFLSEVFGSYSLKTICLKMLCIKSVITVSLLFQTLFSCYAMCWSQPVAYKLLLPNRITSLRSLGRKKISNILHYIYVYNWYFITFCFVLFFLSSIAKFPKGDHRRSRCWGNTLDE